MKKQFIVLILVIALASCRKHKEQKSIKRTLELDSDKQLSSINVKIDKMDTHKNSKNQQLKTKTNKKETKNSQRDDLISELDQEIENRRRNRRTSNKQRRLKRKNDMNKQHMRTKSKQQTESGRMNKREDSKSNEKYPVYYPNYLNQYYNVYSPVASGNILNTLQGNPYMNVRNNPLLGMTPMSTGRFNRLMKKNKQ